MHINAYAASPEYRSWSMASFLPMISHHQMTARFHVTQFSSEHSLDTIYAVICTYFNNNERTNERSKRICIYLSVINLVDQRNENEIK